MGKKKKNWSLEEFVISVNSINQSINQCLMAMLLTFSSKPEFFG
jgi:hypothetical protein